MAMSPTWKPWSCCLEMNWRSGQITALASSSERISCFLSTMVVFALSSFLVFRNTVCVSCRIADCERILQTCAVLRRTFLPTSATSRLTTSYVTTEFKSNGSAKYHYSSASASFLGMDGTLLQHCRVPEPTVWCRFILQTRVFCVENDQVGHHHLQQDQKRESKGLH